MRKVLGGRREFPGERGEVGLTAKKHGDYLLRLGLGVRLGLWGLIRVAPG